MSEAYLRYLGIEATRDLAESDNAKLVIVGDKDGLPLILNPDTLTETEGSDEYPDGLSLEEYRVPDGEQTRPEQFLENYERILAMLDELTNITDELNDNFVDAPVDIDTTIPQQGQVDISTEGGDE
jgi:hypothetical protein